VTLPSQTSTPLYFLTLFTHTLFYPHMKRHIAWVGSSGSSGSSGPPPCKPKLEHPPSTSSISPWLDERIHLFDLGAVIGDEEAAAKVANCVRDLPFIYDHVGGLGTNSPRRGVCVVGDGPTGWKLNTTSWTASQNASNVVATTRTAAMPDQLANIVPTCKRLTAELFPEAPISEASFCLGVANEYKAGTDHTICPHTDAQPWYADPPVFVSLTFFPDGPPADKEHTARFQVKDDTTGKWHDLFLPDRSLCIMRADVWHRVQPPKSKFKSCSKRRLNVTLRNLVDPHKNPFGYAMAMANHYRYYGVPMQLTFPKDVKLEAHAALIARYQHVANKYGKGLAIVQDERSSAERSGRHKTVRTALRAAYSLKRLDLPCMNSMLSKSNVVIDTSERALAWIS